MIADRAQHTRLALVVMLSCITASTGTAAAAEFHLVAGQTVKLMPDDTSVVMWGYALDPDFGGDGVVTVPGPRLVVPPGDATLTVYLRNTLAVPVSIMIPGQIAAMTPVKFTDAQGRQRIRSFTHETAPGATGTYSWSGVRPGTHLYLSGTHSAVQVQMGLYGAATKNAAASEAYVGIGYDREVVLLYSEIDPALHEAVANGTYGTPPMTSTIDYQPKYFLVNGAPYSGTAQPYPVGLPGERTLIRFLNAGLRTHAPMLVGAHMIAVAEDGHAYPYAKEQYSIMLPAGQTKDAVFVPDAAGRYVLFDRGLNLTNAGAPNGGMFSVFVAQGCLYDVDGDGFVGPGDFALFPPCWMACDSDPAWSAYGCERVDFDGNGCVNPGDLAYFASAWLKACGDPTMVLPP